LVRSVNVIPGSVVAEAEEGIDVSTPIGVLRVSDLSGIHGEVDLVVRPEHVRMLARNETIDDMPATNILNGVIVDAARHGAIHALVFRPDDAHRDAELHVFVSDLAYQQLGLSTEQHRSVILPPRALHLMPRDPEAETIGDV
jgi:hypothetical protein